MKKKIILSIVLLLITVAFISFMFMQSSTGPHGGAMKSGEEYNIEMKNSYPDFYAWLIDKSGKPVSNKGLACDVKFLFPDSSSIYTSMKPFGKDGFALKAAALRFYSCRILFKVHGKVVSEEFENENPIAMQRPVLKDSHQ